MFLYILIAALGLSIKASAELTLTPETDFLGIPGLSEISTEWLETISEDPDLGLIQPRFLSTNSRAFFASANLTWRAWGYDNSENEE